MRTYNGGDAAAFRPFRQFARVVNKAHAPVFQFSHDRPVVDQGPERIEPLRAGRVNGVQRARDAVTVPRVLRRPDFDSGLPYLISLLIINHFFD